MTTTALNVLVVTVNVGCLEEDTIARLCATLSAAVGNARLVALHLQELGGASKQLALVSRLENALLMDVVAAQDWASTGLLYNAGAGLASAQSSLTALHRRPHL
jgi:hypothetical protein